MKIPEYETCYELLRRYDVPEHIVEHSRQVASISLWLGASLRAVRIFIDPQLLLGAALLHDIAKMESVRNGRDHAALGAEWLEREGYPEVAEIVLNHVTLETDLTGPIVAKEIVYYADKRVRHSDIVSLAERLDDLRERYGVCSVSMGHLSALEGLTVAVEKKIFAPLDINPENISENLINKNLLTYMAQTNI